MALLSVSAVSDWLVWGGPVLLEVYEESLTHYRHTHSRKEAHTIAMSPLSVAAMKPMLSRFSLLLPRVRIFSIMRSVILEILVH